MASTNHLPIPATIDLAPDESQPSSASKSTSSTSCQQELPRWLRVREAEAKNQLRSDQFCWDKPGVLGLSRPFELKEQQLLDTLQRWVVANMEALRQVRTSTANAMDNTDDVDDSAAQQALADVVADVWQDWSFGDADCLRQRLTLYIKERATDLNISLAQLPTWLYGEMVEVETCLNEKVMYPWIQHFYLFIADHVQCYALAVKDDAAHPGSQNVRLILPFAKPDHKTHDNDGQFRYGVVLDTCPVTGKVEAIEGRPLYKEAFAIIEAKDVLEKPQDLQDSPELNVSEEPTESEEPEALRTPLLKADNSIMDCVFGERTAKDKEAEQADKPDIKRLLGPEMFQAFVQLLSYLRLLYVMQPDRRFAWGITQHGPETRVCIFTSAGAIASHTMDLSCSSGLCEYIRLVTDWSLCDRHQLGYDPTIEYLPEFGCWSIEVPRTSSSGADDTETYYLDDIIRSADRLFGRHTRCFPASKEHFNTPGEKRSDDAIQPRIIPQVLIKDSWRYVEENRGGVILGELECLERIRSIKFADSDPQDCLPILVCGGVVRMKDEMGDTKDTTKSILRHDPNLCELADFHYEHVRIAVSPVCERLCNVRSAYELVAIMGDVARGHQLAYEEQGILHCDISDGNVMFWRNESGKVHGTLIDFDNAIDATVQQEKSRAMGVGTFHFMSVSSLAHPRVQRTGVDDIESFLYLLLWLGTWGVNLADRRLTQGRERLVREWLDITRAAEEKRRLIGNEAKMATCLYQFYHLSADLPKKLFLDLPGGIPAKVMEEAYDQLTDLASELYLGLFHSQIPGVPPDARGSAPRGQALTWRTTEDLNVITFGLRAEPAIGKLIYQDCIELLRTFAAAARAEIDKPTT